MPSQHRLVTVAPGHTVKVRLSRQPAPHAGVVMVEKSHREPFPVATSLWSKAPIA